MAQLEFGDLVRVYIDGHGSPGSEGYIIGAPDYSQGLSDVVMVASEPYHGMPVNSRWCTVLGSRDVRLAERLADRFLSLYPGRLIRPTSPAGLGARGRLS